MEKKDSFEMIFEKKSRIRKFFGVIFLKPEWFLEYDREKKFSPLDPIFDGIGFYVFAGLAAVFFWGTIIIFLVHIGYYLFKN